MLQLICILAILLILFYYYAVKPMSYWKDRGVQQGKCIWFFGDSFKNMFGLEARSEMVLRLYNTTPDIRYFGIYQLTRPSLLIRDPDLIKQIAIKDFDHFVDRRQIVPEGSQEIFARNLLQLKGQQWRDMRAILSPSFTSSKMKSMFILMSECAQNFSNFFLKKNQDILDVDLKDIFPRFTNDIIASASFGIKTDSLEDPSNEFYRTGKEVFTPSSRRFIRFLVSVLFSGLFRLLKMTVIDQHITDFFQNVIFKNLKYRRENKIVRTDMIELLMQAQKGVQEKEEQGIIDTGFASHQEADLGKINKKEISDLDIVAQAMVFFFAGFETVSSFLSFMSYELALNPDIQNKLRNEIEDTIKDCKGNLTYDALSKMIYMDMVVSETLRKYPNAPLLERTCTRSYTIEPKTFDEKPLHIKEGSSVFIPVLGLHRDPKYYPEPERFDPDRFSIENRGNINPNTYIPFGTGPRVCIGSRFALLEIKTVMFYLLSIFEIVPTAKTPIPLKLQMRSLTMKADGEFHIGLKRIVKFQ